MARKKKRRRAGKSASTKGPARVLIELSPHRQVGGLHFPGLTLYPAEWEAPIERHLIRLALFCHDVRLIETQPEELPYTDVDGDKHYTPDVALTLDRGRIFIEDKPLAILVREENLAKYLDIVRFLRTQGHALEFITEDQIPETWLKNANLLRLYLVPDRVVTLPDIIADTLREGPRTIEDVLTTTAAAVTLADMYSLVAHRLLCIDWDERLGRRARVSLPDKPDSFQRLTYDRVRAAGRFADLLAEMAVGRRPPDQRLLAARSARRRPLSAASATGFVDGFTPGQLGHLERQRAARPREEPDLATRDPGPGDRAKPQSTEDQ